MRPNDLPLQQSSPVSPPDVPRWDDVEIVAPLFNHSLLATRRDDVHRLYTDLARHRPVFRDATGAWVISHSAIGAHVLADRRFPSGPPAEARKRQSATDALILLRDDDQHAKLRRWYAPLFQSRRLDRLHAFVKRDIDRVLRRLPVHADVDFVAHIARVVTGRSACVFMGLDPSHADRLVLETWPILPLLIGLPMPEDQEAALVERAQPMLRHLRRLLGDAAARCPDDGEEAGENDGAASVLAGEPFSDDEAYGWNSVFMFAAAYATNLLTLGNIMRLALSIEGVWRLLASQPECAQAVVSELMRLDPAIHGIQRYVAQDVMVAQHLFRRGESVFVMVGAANRDPQVFNEPERFRPGRRGKTLTFGNGPHSCMGAGLARQLLANVLAATARRWPELSLSPRAERGIQVGVFTGYESLWVNSANTISHNPARESHMHRTDAS